MKEIKPNLSDPKGCDIATIYKPDEEDVTLLECSGLVRTGEDKAMLVESRRKKIGSGVKIVKVPRLVRAEGLEAESFLAKLPLPGEIQSVVSPPDITRPDITKHLSGAEKLLRIAREAGRGITVTISSGFSFRAKRKDVFNSWVLSGLGVASRLSDTEKRRKVAGVIESIEHPALSVEEQGDLRDIFQNPFLLRVYENLVSA